MRRNGVADEHHPGPFDTDTIFKLVKLMDRHDISEILLEQGDARIRLRRGPAATVVSSPSHIVPATLPAPIAHTAPATPASQGSAPRPAGKTLHEIKSPMVGTFYRAENPEAEPYVKVGSHITPETVICKIEAMKLFNDITADCTGVITEILVENAQPVEFNTVLFRVDTAG
jgi:acetyl-CoA carboxylase biotin carboxyl carrier protein